MAGLKSFLPVMAEAFGTTADALYSRQRALTQMGLLPYVAGKGPGSGVPLTADSLGVMIIALMASDNLRDTDTRVKKLCEAPPDKLIGDESKHYMALPTFRSAMETAIKEFGQQHSGFVVKSIRVSPDKGQFLLIELSKSSSSGFQTERNLKTKTFRVKRTKSVTTKVSSIVRTSELDLLTLPFARLMNEFAIAEKQV
ncbi:hypothetical protein ACFFWD_03665 [Bradyrhizobium erythrophlei]|uniref:hypothetical protein n=1 Tax=Bradyrhizobium erythrophlei TaxID=1437360 RepID=UPI0035EC6BDA